MKRLIIAVFLSILFLSGCNNNQLDALTKEQKQLQASIQTLETKVTDLTTENTSLTKLADDLAAKANVLSQEKEELINSSLALGNVNESLKAQVSALNNETTKLATIYEETQAVKTELELKLEKELEAQLTNLELELYQAQKDVQKLTAKRQEVLERLGRPVTEFVIEEDNSSQSLEEQVGSDAKMQEDNTEVVDEPSEVVLNTADESLDAEISKEVEPVIETTEETADESSSDSDTTEPATLEESSDESPVAAATAEETDAVVSTEEAETVDISTEAVVEVVEADVEQTDTEQTDTEQEQSITMASDSVDNNTNESVATAANEDHKIESPNQINYDNKPEDKTEDNN